MYVCLSDAKCTQQYQLAQGKLVTLYVLSGNMLSRVMFQMAGMPMRAAPDVTYTVQGMADMLRVCG